MTLSYGREYRTLFHRGNAFGISEGTASRRVRWVEDVLIKAQRFALPARSHRVAADQTALQAVVSDASESPMERPPTTSAAGTAVSANAPPGKAQSCWTVPAGAS
jgi:hypothetical protein